MVKNVSPEQKFERLTVIERVKGHNSLWLCKCDCGKMLNVYSSQLLNNHTKSCGCLNNEKRKQLPLRKRTHGKTSTILYSKYYSMKCRCNNPNYSSYDRYGGRGIKVCDEWQHSFEAFWDWAYANGYDDRKKGYEQTLDRIDVDGDYSPDNCRWVDGCTQSKNKSDNVYLKYHGEKMILSDFCKKYGITYHKFVQRRLVKGVSLDTILKEWQLKNSLDYFNIDDAAKYYNVSKQTIYKWIKKKVIYAEKVGCIYYIKKEQSQNES